MESDDEMSLLETDSISQSSTAPLPNFARTGSLSNRRISLNDADLIAPRAVPKPIATSSSRASRITHPRPLPTPGRSAPPHPALLPSAPASPPTPAPSPTPHQRAPSWTSAAEDEDNVYRDSRAQFSLLDSTQKQRYLAELLNMCDSHLLSFVHHFVSPRLKKDPFSYLPTELCLRVSKKKRILYCNSLIRFDRYCRSWTRRGHSHELVRSPKNGTSYCRMI